MRSGACAAARFDVDVTDLSNPPSVADPTSAIADRDQLERGFSRLEPEERAVIVLHHYLDLPLPEVAATLGIPLGTTKSRLYRGLREMRAALDADARPGPTSERGARHEPQRRASTATSPTGSTRMPSTGCRSTSMPSCVGPGRSASDRHGRASKGGSPCKQHFASRRSPGSPGCWWSSAWCSRSARPPCWIGSRHRRLPARSDRPATGRSCTATTATSTAVDTVTHAATPAHRRPAFDFGPAFSRDGTRLMFLRGSAPPDDQGSARVPADDHGGGRPTVSDVDR